MDKINNESYILLYHGVTDSKSVGIENISGKHIEASEFDKQMNWLKKNKKVVSLKNINDKSDSVAITFDDTFKNVHDVALPILKKYKLPATFFVSTGFIETDKLFWVDKLEHMINFPEKFLMELDFDGIERRFSITGFNDKSITLNIIKSVLKTKNPDERDEILNDIEKQIGFDKNNIPKNYENLSWNDVKSLDGGSQYEVGGHSVNHEILSYLDDEKLEYEIGDCIKTLSKHLKRKNIDSFSYPEGQKNHYNDKVISILKKHGVNICPSAIDGAVDGNDDNFNLKRIMVGFQGKKFPFKEYHND